MQFTLDQADTLDNHQFELVVRRLADSLSFGADPSPFHGSGVEYSQSRPYEPGDPIKSIDWRLTARAGKVFVKEYEAPKRLPVWLVLDTSASMCVSGGRVSKYAWAVRLAGGLALAALRRFSPVGLVGCGEHRLRMRPTLSRQDVYTWLHHLRRFRIDQRTRLGPAIVELRPMLEVRSLLIVLSDLHDPTGIPAIKPLAQQHDCVVLRLQDPAERGRTGGGIFRATEAETGALFTATGRSRFLSDDAAEQLKRAGIDQMTLQIDTHFLPRLRQFLHRRNLLGGRR